MKQFHYIDYLCYQILKAKEQRKGLSLREPSEEYHVHQPHDKIFKTVLNEKSQVVELLNKVLKLQHPLQEDEIEKYPSEYINQSFKSFQTDMVYKMKKQEIFFLIEHQRSIDYSMPKRIIEYEVEIIRQAIKDKTMTKKDHRLPRVIPIVIYTGNRQWNVEKYIEECQEILPQSEQVKLGQYYVVDVNDYTNEELEKDSLFISKILLLEKLKTEKEIFETLSRIIQKEKEEKKRMLLKKIITYVLEEKLKPDDKKSY